MQCMFSIKVYYRFPKDNPYLGFYGSFDYYNNNISSFMDHSSLIKTSLSYD